ncbi:MAG: putative Ig domain-containing protein, partial [Firmicutes bacterium]|nr:putative Ig domain-containing protein [Candidatus Colimorpha enterica]
AKASLGDFVEVRAAVTENCGISAGTLFFAFTDNLEFVSATLLGASAEAVMATEGENSGAYGIILLDATGSAYTSVTDNFCGVSFRVIGTGEAKISLWLYDGITNTFENITGNRPEVSFGISVPDAPVVKTSSLPDAYLGRAYSTMLETENAQYSEWTEWEITDGDLPDGLTLLNDGTICGTPEEYGSFRFKVTAEILEGIISEEKEISLKVEERPKELELIDGSKYIIDAENKYLKNVPAEVNPSELISQFLSPEMIKVFDADGSELASDGYVGTGCTVSLMNGEDKLDTLTVVVKGDVSGDGEIATIDFQRIRAYYLDKYDLSGAYLEAALVAGNETVATIDFQRVRAHYLGKYNLYA